MLLRLGRIWLSFIINIEISVTRRAHCTSERCLAASVAKSDSLIKLITFCMSEFDSFGLKSFEACMEAIPIISLFIGPLQLFKRRRFNDR